MSNWKFVYFYKLGVDMIEVQSAKSVPDPLSVPENAPEHCPVCSNTHDNHLLNIPYFIRAPNLNLQGKQMHVMVARTKIYVLQISQRGQTQHYRSSKHE